MKLTEITQINERPVGRVKQAIDKAISSLPGNTSMSAKAQGRTATAEIANTLFKQFMQLVGKQGINPVTGLTVRNFFVQYNIQPQQTNAVIKKAVPTAPASPVKGQGPILNKAALERVFLQMVQTYDIDVGAEAEPLAPTSPTQVPGIDPSLIDQLKQLSLDQRKALAQALTAQ